jgi:hypothetical protein
MATKFIGVTFPLSFQWHNEEIEVIDSVTKQIELKFPNEENLLVNSTWLGPQFDNGAYKNLLESANSHVDNIFLLSSIDPMFLNRDQIDNILDLLKNPVLYKIGHFDNTKYEFNFHASKILPRHFKSYNTDQLLMTDPKYIFLSYNRKPREHRVNFVNKLIANNLKEFGIVTLGENREIYSKTDKNDLYLPLADDIVSNTWTTKVDTFGNIPDDLHSLGNMSIWQSHFLNITSETEFWPWDNTYVSEKTWKPIVGLRPFLLNGQIKIYQWLRDRGFKTFNHYFNGIKLENVNEFEVHDSIIKVLQYLTTLDKKEITAMYNDMLPDLIHNRNRFFEFSKEQTYKIDHIFK